MNPANRPAAFAHPVYVTRPLLPPLEDYTALLRQVWSSAWLTNGGAQHQALEALDNNMVPELPEELP